MSAPDFLGRMMAKPKKNSRTSTPPRSAIEVDAKARTKEQIQEVRNQVTNVILDSSVEMVNRVVQSVIDGGQITALKFLWETAGMFPNESQGENGESDSLAKILLERMGLTPDIPEDNTEDGA